jgi:hypothetical protein
MNAPLRRRTGLALSGVLLAFAARLEADALIDPTRPPASVTRAAAVPDKPPVLSAIMGTEGARLAIFNGQLVRSGGSVGSYVIEAVFEDGVRYRHAGVTRELRLPGSSTIRKPSKAETPASSGAQ